MNNSPTVPSSKLLSNISSSSGTALFVIIALFALVIFIYNVGFKETKDSDCKKMNQAYGSVNPNISQIDKSFTNRILDYYIYGSYNSCSGGSYKGGYVDVCNLQAVLRQGARFIDVEIFNEDGDPVIATSDNQKNYYVKTSKNSLPFAQFMSTLIDYGFGDNAPNKTDPLILHLRVQSNQVPIYDKMANIFKQYDNRMLSTKNSFAENNTNFGNFPLVKAINKIILFVDGSNNTYLQSEPFYEYVNMVSNSPFLWLQTNFDIVNNPDIQDLTNNNKNNMTIVLPDKGSNPSNPSALLAQQYGCQIVAMRFQNMDGYLNECNDFFNKAGTAFVLKPEELREKQVTVPPPVQQNPEYSYATREVSTNLYSFKY